MPWTTPEERNNISRFLTSYRHPLHPVSPIFSQNKIISSGTREGHRPMSSFGPPRGAKKSTAPASNAGPTVVNPVSEIEPNSAVSSAKITAANPGGTGNSIESASRGPSPPVSRAPTPVSLIGDSISSALSNTQTPAVDRECQFAASVLTASLTDIPATLRPVRSTSMEPETSRPLEEPSQRACSVQPTPSNWTGAAFSTSVLAYNAACDKQATSGTYTSTPSFASPTDAHPPFDAADSTTTAKQIGRTLVIADTAANLAMTLSTDADAPFPYSAGINRRTNRSGFGRRSWKEVWS